MPHKKKSKPSAIKQKEKELAGSKATSIQEAVVGTACGLPDMRYAENRAKFLRDVTRRTGGYTG